LSKPGEARKRLVITEDELAGGATPPASPARPSAEPSLPTVEGIRPSRAQVPIASLAGAPAGVGAPFHRTVQGRNLLAALVGITLGWAVCEITKFGLWTATTTLGLDFTTAAYTAAVGLSFAVVYAGWEAILSRSGEGFGLAVRRAAPVAVASAFAAGFIAQIVYHHFVLQILRGLTLGDLVNISSNIKLYLARALAWGLFGVGMGVAVAGGVRAKMVNGVIGGGIGGTLGGLAFHWASFNITSGAAARLVGLAVIGVSIGLAIGFVERARREAWLHIASGPMVGKEFIIYTSECTLGSSPKCDVTLIKDPSIQPFHARIVSAAEAGSQRRDLDAYDGCHVTVNGMPLAHHRLRSGDTIGIGGMALAYSERRQV
jgi:hypothetical protein